LLMFFTSGASPFPDRDDRALRDPLRVRVYVPCS
jgi:hypothetical protein